MVERLFVAAFACQRVIYIGERHDLRGNRYLLAGETVRIAAAVIAFVVPAADLVGLAHERLVLVGLQTLQNGRTHGGVRFHDFERFAGQSARLVENTLGDVDLANVVQRGGGHDKIDVGIVQRIAVGPLDEGAEQKLGRGTDVQHVHAALAVSELNDVAEDTDHQVVRLIALVDLLRDKVHQAFLLGVQQQCIDNAAADNGHVERPADVVGRAEIVGVFHHAGVALRRDHDNRNLADPVVLVHGLEHTESVHFGHHDVQQQQVNIRAAAQYRYGLKSVFGFYELIIIAKDLY